jgi:hypothetical protein
MILAILLDLSGTVITLQPTDAPGAVAEVQMYNHAANGPDDNSSHTLTLDGLDVEVKFTWDAGGDQPDALVVTPPDGVLCDPADCTLILDEGATGRVVLFEWVGF